jgi:hypothetical protein
MLNFPTNVTVLPPSRIIIFVAGLEGLTAGGELEMKQ